MKIILSTMAVLVIGPSIAAAQEMAELLDQSTEPGPRRMVFRTGCDSFHTKERFGTAFYYWHGHPYLTTLERIRANGDYKQYREAEYPGWVWAFGRHYCLRLGYEIWVKPGTNHWHFWGYGRGVVPANTNDRDPKLTGKPSDDGAKMKKNEPKAKSPKADIESATGTWPEPAHIEVHLPANATLTIDMHITKATGPKRIFTSPPIRHGVPHWYTLTATWRENGIDQRLSRAVLLQAGQRTTVSFMPPTVKSIAGTDNDASGVAARQ